MASETFTYTILTGTISTPGSIKNWVQHSSIPAEQILEEAQQFIYQRLRIQDMIVREDISIGAGDYTAAIPDGFLDPVFIKLNGDNDELDYVQENLLGRYKDPDGVVAEGRPCRWSIYDNLLQFDVANDDDEALAGDIVFYKFPALLNAGTQTNFLTDRFGRLLRQTCLAVGYEHRKRPEASTEFLLAEKAIGEANTTADMRRRGQIMR